MELFGKAKAVKLRSHHNKYLVADDDQVKVRQSRNGSSRKARWLVELIDGGSGDTPQVIRLKSCHGGYLAATETPFLLGMTGNKVIQAKPENLGDVYVGWEPMRDGFQVKLRNFGGKFLRANGGPPPWRNSVTHDTTYSRNTHKWILWDVEEVEIPENESLTSYLSMVSSFSILSDDQVSELGSPTSVHSMSMANSPMSINSMANYSPTLSMKKSGMDLFQNAKAVRLESHAHRNKYLIADDDEESVIQNRQGSSKSARWTVEVVDNTDNVIRLKSCYGKYLTASNLPFLLGMTGRKVLQTLPAGRLGSSVEWEPIREGNHVKLRTRYGQFLRANGGVPPWRNSVTHDIPQRTSTQDWILWDVHIVEIILRSPRPNTPAQSLSNSESFASEPSSPSIHSTNGPNDYERQESSESLGNSASMVPVADGRIIYYHIADDNGNLDESMEALCISFKGNGVEELTRRLEEEMGIDNIVVCSRSPLNGKLYPLRLQLPPNNMTMHVVVVDSTSTVARDFVKTGIPW